jgi:mannosyltransferase OCH1-like enzyme
MIPKIFHQSSKRFTWEETRFAKKAQELMPEWRYHAWTDEDNLALVEKKFPSDVEEYVRLPHGGSKVDIARYLYMYEYGGIYFDTDFRFFRPINDDLLSHLCILGIEVDDAPDVGGGPKLGNAFIGSQPGLALWPEFVESIFTRFRKGQIDSDAAYLSGPHALTAFLRNHKHYENIVTKLPRNVVYPPLTKFNLTGIRAPETIGVHLCWSTWRDRSLPIKIRNRTRRLLSGAFISNI